MTEFALGSKRMRLCMSEMFALEQLRLGKSKFFRTTSVRTNHIRTKVTNGTMEFQ